MICIFLFFLRVDIVSEKLVKNFLSLISTPIAIFDMVGVLVHRFTNVRINEEGRLSTQKNPLSSKAFSAIVFPDPERPVKIMVESRSLL
ncbi:hypothetical protein BMS3Abin06_00038 [bacterium BMS3Abin06]|nr:hypothetical protein BMS3Abin06_00038 [bacterium BMS3Abin06]